MTLSRKCISRTNSVLCYCTLYAAVLPLSRDVVHFYHMFKSDVCSLAQVRFLMTNLDKLSHFTGFYLTVSGTVGEFYMCQWKTLLIIRAISETIRSVITFKTIKHMTKHYHYHNMMQLSICLLEHQNVWWLLNWWLKINLQENDARLLMERAKTHINSISSVGGIKGLYCERVCKVLRVWV